MSSSKSPAQSIEIPIACGAFLAGNVDVDQAADVDPFVQQAKAVLDLSCLRLENASPGQTFRCRPLIPPHFRADCVKQRQVTPRASLVCASVAVYAVIP